MSSQPNGRIPVTNPRAVQLRDLSDESVQDEARKLARRNAELTIARMIRARNRRPTKDA